MEHQMKNNKEIINYLIFGVLTTVINIISYSFFIEIAHINYKPATSLAWLIAVIFAFVTNKFFVYNSKTNDIITAAREFIFFIFFRILSLLIDLGMMIALVDGIGVSSIYAKIYTNVAVVVFNYFASKFFIFQTKK